jgi:hypothetical protein
MTPRQPSPPAPSRTGGRRPLIAPRDEFPDHDDPGWFDPYDNAEQCPRSRRADTDGQTARPGIDSVLAGWDDLGPEAA